MKVSPDSARIGFPPPFIYLGMVLAGLALDRVLPWRIPGDPMLLLELGLVIGAVGIALLLAATGLFRRRGTDVKPWRPTTALVDSGPYAVTRNPMYLAMAIVYLGIAVGVGSVGAMILFVPVILLVQTQVIAREETYLRAKFGDNYDSYCRRVRRWL